MAAILALLAWLAFASGQSAPAAFPPADAKLIIDNPRVAVWDVSLPAGKPTALHRREHDLVAVYPIGGEVKVTRQDRTSSSVTVRKPGEAFFRAKGSVHIEESAAGGQGTRVIAIELKDFVAPPTKNTSKYPDAFSTRPGMRKLLENDRLILWTYTWQRGKPTAMHFHDRDVVVVFLDAGTLRSTTPDGAQTFNEITVGKTMFNSRDRTHIEELIKGKASGVMIELK